MPINYYIMPGAIDVIKKWIEFICIWHYCKHNTNKTNNRPNKSHNTGHAQPLIAAIQSVACL